MNDYYEGVVDVVKAIWKVLAYACKKKCKNIKGFAKKNNAKQGKKGTMEDNSDPLTYFLTVYNNLYMFFSFVLFFFFFAVPDHIRPRVCSLPEKPYNPRLSDDLYRLRTFSITNKGGVVNCGDSIINRRSRSNTSVNSTASRWVNFLLKKNTIS